MPSKTSRQVTIRKKVRETEVDTLDSDAILDQVLKAICAKARIVRRYEVPYLGGSSKSGTIYIDRRMPQTTRIRKHRVHVLPFIVLHEAVERAVGDRLGLRYQLAHQIALRIEESAVRAAGISWHDYNAFMQKQLKVVAESFTTLPPDLDLKPYRDEKDTATLRKIHALRRSSKPRTKPPGNGRRGK